MITQANLAAVNSATKYPSIPTYHAMGEKGRLTEEINVNFCGPVHISEKIDGTNARIVVVGDRYLIGSREELLTASGDLICNPSMGIVDGVRAIAERAVGAIGNGISVTVLYGEFYGGRVTASSKQYTTSGATGFRLFDAAYFDLPLFKDIIALDTATIAAWRDGGGQAFGSTEAVAVVAAAVGVDRVPSVDGLDDLGWPMTIAETRDWLCRVLECGSYAKLDVNAGGRPEGVVVRDAERRIAKLRVEDYERTMKGRGL